MMKRNDGWDNNDDQENEYYVKGGTCRRKEVASGEKRGGQSGTSDGRKMTTKPGRKRNDKGKPWK